MKKKHRKASDARSIRNPAPHTEKVITSGKRIVCFVTGLGNNVIEEWLTSLAVEAGEAARTFLRLMDRSSDWAQDWVMPQYRHSMKGKPILTELGELRWKHSNVPHRVLGRLDMREFRALIGCTHNQQKYNPPNTLKTAEKRWKELKSEKGNTVRYEF